jgi:hypothetical protein
MTARVWASSPLSSDTALGAVFTCNLSANLFFGQKEREKERKERKRESKKEEEKEREREREN